MSTQGIICASDEQIERLRRLASDSDDAVDCALTAVLDDHKRMSDELKRYRKGVPVAWASMLGAFAHVQWGSKPDDNIHTMPLYAAPQPTEKEFS